jgi:translation initiation factor 3 subunit M
MLVSLWLDFNIEVACFQGNIESVINTIQANKITEDSSQAVQGMMIR